MPYPYLLQVLGMSRCEMSQCASVYGACHFVTDLCRKLHRRLSHFCGNIISTCLSIMLTLQKTNERYMYN